MLCSLNSKGYKQDRNLRERGRDEESRKKAGQWGKGKEREEEGMSCLKVSTTAVHWRWGRVVGAPQAFGMGLPDFWALPAPPLRLCPLDQVFCSHLAWFLPHSSLSAHVLCVPSLFLLPGSQVPASAQNSFQQVQKATSSLIFERGSLLSVSVPNSRNLTWSLLTAPWYLSR